MLGAPAGTDLDPFLVTPLRAHAGTRVTTAPRDGSDLVVDLLRAVGVEHVALNPGATFRGLHDSLVNYGGTRTPELILTTHEEIAVRLAHGYAKAKGRPMAAIVHDIVGPGATATPCRRAEPLGAALVDLAGESQHLADRLPSSWCHRDRWRIGGTQALRDSSESAVCRCPRSGQGGG